MSLEGKSQICIFGTVVHGTEFISGNREANSRTARFVLEEDGESPEYQNKTGRRTRIIVEGGNSALMTHRKIGSGAEVEITGVLVPAKGLRPTLRKSENEYRNENVIASSIVFRSGKGPVKLF